MDGFHDSMGRLGPFAAVDVMLTAAAALPVSRVTGTSFWTALVSLLVLGTLVHLMLGVATPVTTKLTAAAA